MIADDQELIRQSLQIVLEMKEGIEVTASAKDGREVIQEVRKNKPDVILMDVRMPEMDGVQCTQIIKEQYPDIKIIILTTFDDDEYVYNALKHGASGYLLKGISMDELEKAIKTVHSGGAMINPEVATKVVDFFSEMAQSNYDTSIHAQNVEEITEAELKTALRKACIACELMPVMCGSAYRNKGVQKLLDGVVEYMPAPTDIPAIKGIDPATGEETERHASDEEPFSALVFKVMNDPFVGKLAFFRVYSGTLDSGTYVYNSTKGGKKERVGRILQMHANHREEIDRVYSGDIAAAVGFKISTTGDTICDEDHEVILESMVFPEPVISVAIEPKTKAGRDKMGIALAKLAEEDPTFKTYTDSETGDTIISGMGELHLEIIVDRLLREFKVEANVGAPQVAYKETFTKAVDVDSKYAKQSGGRGQYGHCKVHFEPMDANGEELFKFESTVVGGSIPKEYIPAVGEGIEEAAQSGILGGFPVLGVKATVYDGSYHDVDSSEMAFHIAGSMAFKEAMQKAGAILLEPIMRVEVTMPEEYMGDVIGDINSRRGRIEGMDDIASGKMVRAFVPLSEMFGYSTDLRSRTQGRGNYSMFFDHYEKVPKNVQEKILDAHLAAQNK